METETPTYNAYELANMADVAGPDGPSSPGAEWLENVASVANDILVDHDRADDYPDDITEAADQTVPTYTHERWQVFVDLAAYNEDVTELGPVDDLTTAAGVALYMIAERLIRAIIEDQADQAESTDDEDD